MTTRPKQSAITALATLLAVLLACISAKAVTVALPAIQDTTIYDVLAATSNGGGQGFFSGITSSGGGDVTRGLIMFDVSAVPTSATINSATLTLHHNSPSGGSNESIRLHKLTADWGEENSVPGNDQTDRGGGFGTTALSGDATWADRFSPSDPWMTPGGEFSSTVSASRFVSINGFYDWTSPQLADDVTDWIIDPANNFGWILLNIDAGNNDGLAKRFDTRENSIVANRPALTIDYTLDVGADFDNDTDVDGDDLGDWQSAYGPGNGGDADGDNDSDGADFLVWQREFTGPGMLQSVTVPEPTSALLALFCTAVAWLIRHDRVSYD